MKAAAPGRRRAGRRLLRPPAVRFVRLLTSSRLGLSRAVIGIRAIACALTLVTAIAVTAADQAPVVTALAGLAVLAGAVGAVAPNWVWPTATLGLLAAAYAVAAASAGPGARLAGALGIAAVLWVIHTLYALAAAVPVRAEIEPALIETWRRRLATTLGIALPIVAVTVLLGGRSPGWPWLRGLGVVAALAIAAVPLLLPRGRSAGNTSAD